MKKFLITSGVGIGIAFLILLTTLKAQDQKKEETAAQAIGQESVVYTFKDDADIQAFQQLVQARQIVNTRIVVLQTYLAQEAANLQSINGQLSLNYKIDPAKSYTMDPVKRVIVEVQTPPAQTGAGTQIQAQTQTTPPATP